VTTAAYAELEISLSRSGGGELSTSRVYGVELRFTQPESDADVRVGGRQASVSRIDLELLAGLNHDQAAYGRALGEGLFAAPEVTEALGKAVTAAESLGAPLRLRLAIGADAPELHALRWELLRTPDGALVSASERILFSRYLASVDWQPVKLRPRSSLRALVVVAASAELERYGLAPIDAAGELARLREVLAGAEIVTLDGPASVTAIVDRLREGFDLFYLVAHGTLASGEAIVWLESDGGGVARIRGVELVARIAELEHRPRLAVLVSCQSAGDGAEGVLCALGPGLARAGVAAVVAMQSNLAMATAALLMPRFFKELMVDGQVDRALAVARSVARETTDWWVPALFMRLRSGRIWYTPGFGGESGRFEKWPSLIDAIQKGRCTPVLGPALGSLFYGSSRELARRWADQFNYPMAPGGREDLQSVAQYVAIHQDERFPMEQLESSLRDAVAARFPAALPADVSSMPLDDVLATVADWRLERRQFDPYRVLAGLPCKLYITTSCDDLLGHHLRATGREPVVATCPWAEAVPPDQESLQCDLKRPLLYHLFGRFSEPDSLVITENDIFDFLINVNPGAKISRIPSAVSAALVSSALLILGFPIDDWKFRVFIRTLMNQPGKQLRKSYTHVAAQIDPEDGRAADGERARRYLENYFETSRITIFWGSAEDFLQELESRLPARSGA
jgi:hypothetical protein